MLKRRLCRMIIQLCIHSLPLTLVLCVAAVLMCMCPASMPLDNDVSLPPRKHTGGQVHIPPPGVLAWVGGVAWRCARVGLLYIS